MFNETTEFATLAMEHSAVIDVFIEDGRYFVALLIKTLGLKIFSIVAFCGILGFHQFTNNKEWIRNMISWQHTNGCWSYEKFPDHVDEDQHNHKNKRRKRSDTLIGSSKCSLHTTTLAGS